MPNWCNTTYRCIGNPKEIRQLHNAIKKNDKRKTPRVGNGFGKLWLGCIIDQLGGDWEKYRCRGEITDYYMEPDASMLTIYQCTAWCEQEGVRQVIEEKFPSINVYYREEEPGCGVYYTNSFDVFPEHYFLDSYDDIDNPYFETIEEAAECVSEIVGHKVEPTTTTICDALDDYVEQHPEKDLFYSFHEFTLCED